MQKYNHKKIEAKWQKLWQAKKVFQARDFSKKPKKYILVEFPYPSGAGLHMGHLRPYVAADVYTRYSRMKGHEALFPIGWDAFGLPAENYAIKMGVHPSKTTAQNVKNAKKQMQSWGLSFDWSREINTTDPNYYKWTQWLFLQFYKKGLAYEATGLINWCPKDKTGLANEEVIDGKCERCGTVVEKKELRQWYLKITAYAEKLLEGLKHLPEWPEAVKLQQENWIGKSVGAEISFPVVVNTYHQGRHSEGVHPTEESQSPNYLILHGRNGSPDSHTFPWLKSQLESRGFKAQVPTLPNTDEPDDIEQMDFVLKNCIIDENTLIIGHSFGGIVALRLLEKGIKVKQVILMCTPFSGKFLDKKPRLSVTRACLKGFDFSKIKANAKDFILLYDTSDYVVPMSDGESFAEKLNGHLLKLKGQEPHLSGKTELEVLSVILPSIKVFTTRPDTIFGATYMVMAPEHPIIENYKLRISNYEEVKSYIEQAKKKSEMDRSSEGKEKTGVELKGVKAINPATKEEIPVWVADYVLSGYGTGAIMAVPAHDERDFEFAKKYNLPIKQVIAPLLVSSEGVLAFHPDEPIIKRTVIRAIVKHWSEDSYLVLNWNDGNRKTFVSGGVEDGEQLEAAALREIREETGYTDAKFVRKLGAVKARFYAPNKKQNREDIQNGLYFELKSGQQSEVAAKEKNIHSHVWLPKSEILKNISWGLVDPIFWGRLQNSETAFVEDGVLINSGQFDGIKSEEAVPKMAAAFGKPTIQYKLRDWVFSRQRYWGEPIPIIHCPKCGIVPVPEKDLPVKLPPVKKYEPTGTGESPLAVISKWVNVKCPVCKSSAKRETNTMPQWAGSSWYWLRYTDPKDKKVFADLKKQKYWTPVDVYFGGMEHTTLHLLYSRFWNLFLYDQKLVTSREPYTLRKPHGIILGPDGEKMSKSRGNVVNPQDIVASHGADTLRMFELFLGPHEDTIAWNGESVVGVKRFLDRVWNWVNQVQGSRFKVQDPDKVQRALNKLIKKISEDIENFHFNTSISAFMEFHNEIKDEPISLESIKIFLKLLYPFAPHISEEINQIVGISHGRAKSPQSLQMESWPVFDPANTVDANVEIVVQVNGKVKGKVIVPSGSDEKTVKELGTNLEAVKILLNGQTIKRTIFVPGRLINLVI